MTQRIQKALLDADVGSRSEIEEMIETGRVTLNGRRIRRMPCFIDEQDEVRLDGERIATTPRRLVHFLLNKPRGVTCGRPEVGRPSAEGVVPPSGEKVQAVGELDTDSTGLVVITNDRELAAAITSPASQLEMAYQMEVDGKLTPEDVARLTTDFFVNGRRVRAVKLRVLQRGADRSVIELRLREFHMPQVLRLLRSMNHRPRRVKRSAIGPINEHGLKIGHFRVLTADEVERLGGRRKQHASGELSDSGGRYDRPVGDGADLPEVRDADAPARVAPRKKRLKDR